LWAVNQNDHSDDQNNTHEMGTREDKGVDIHRELLKQVNCVTGEKTTQRMKMGNI